MKRLHIWLLICLLIATLAACGGEAAEETDPPEEEIVEVEDPVEATPEEPEEKPSEQPEQKPVTNSGGSSSEPSKPKIPQSDKAYLARINLTHCTVNIYTKDENGEYTVPLKAMICSTGYATPGAGKFYRLGETWEWLRLKGNVYGHYVTQITGNILFHSVPYLRWGDPASLEYWEFDKLGVKASQGCIRLQVSDAIWIYNNAWNIVGVEFYSDDDPGPFGKPTAPKISENEACRDWDPTDPNPENPWHSYLAGEDTEVEIDPETGLPVEDEETEAPEKEVPAEGGETAEDPAETPSEETPEETPETPEQPPNDGDTPVDSETDPTEPEAETENPPAAA